MTADSQKGPGAYREGARGAPPRTASLTPWDRVAESGPGSHCGEVEGGRNCKGTDRKEKSQVLELLEALFKNAPLTTCNR